MSVLIRGMEMPSMCCHCDFARREYWTTDTVCIADNRRKITVNLNTGRDDACPLVHVLPHGRLIDADKATEKVWELMRFPSNLVNTQWIENTLREMPTVIPADKEET